MTRDGRRTGVLLSGYYGCGNLGDDLLLTVTAQELRAIIPDASFLVRDHGDALPPLGPHVVQTGVDAILDDQTRSRLSRLVSFAWRIAGLLRQCRWLVFGGGTVFHENGGLASLALQWLVCRLARALGVRIAALGIGIGDLRTRTGRWLLRDVVARCELFLVRDDAALRQCTGTKARQTEDLVFAWRSLPPEHHRGRSEASASIGLTVSPQASERTIAALADAVRIWRQHGHRVVFLVFQQGAAVTGDAKIFAALGEMLGGAAMPELRRPTADASAIVDAFADIDVVCGMRFHGLVLAAMLERPFIGIAHDNKISEICRRFHMPCHEAATLEAADLVRSTEAIRHVASERQLLERSRSLAHENFSAFASLLSR